MSRFHSYLNSASVILSSYKGTEPFASHLKKVFSANKKFGSKDRKQVAHICYCHFRLGKLFEGMETEERLLLAVFLCSQEPDSLLQYCKPNWNEKISIPVDEKLKMIDKTADASLLFPFADELSEDIDVDKFAVSHLVQPNLFLRIRPGNKERVEQKLADAGMAYERTNETCIALPNSTKVEQLLKLNKEIVVQDFSSQRVGDLLRKIDKTGKISVWDCCAASGGKSIMAVDLLKNVDLTVSDIRESILFNLKKRFTEAGIKRYKSFVADVSSATAISKTIFYDVVIADVPCSGSGTWGRTPEHLLFFDKKSIDTYSTLQKKIVTNVIPQISTDGYLLYITCSVFKKENEDIVEFIKQQASFQVIEMKLLKGYEQKADSMFAALLQKK